MITYIKDLIKIYSTFHFPDKRKNVFLFSSPRSGSTWLLEILMTQKGYKWVREPFNLRKAYVRKHSGISDWTELYNESCLPKIDQYIQTLANHNIRDIGYKYPEPFQDFWRLVTHGTIFKILHACEHHIEHLKNKFNGKVIFLLRHPIPVSISREEYPRLEAFLKSDYSLFFTEEQISCAWDIIKKGNMLQKGVLDWALQNAIPLWQQKEDWLVITYEDLVLYPEQVIDKLSNFLDDASKEKMMSRLDIASGSTGKSKEESKQILSNPKKLRENKKWLVEKWLPKVSQAEMVDVQKTLDMFSITIYSAHEAMPNTILHQST